jgi:hypothetical protein
MSSPSTWRVGIVKQFLRTMLISFSFLFQPSFRFPLTYLTYFRLTSTYLSTQRFFWNFFYLFFLIPNTTTLRASPSPSRTARKQTSSSPASPHRPPSGPQLAPRRDVNQPYGALCHKPRNDVLTSAARAEERKHTKYDAICAATGSRSKRRRARCLLHHESLASVYHSYLLFQRASALPKDVLLGKLAKDISFALRRGTIAQVTTHHHLALDGCAWPARARPPRIRRSPGVAVEGMMCSTLGNRARRSANEMSFASLPSSTSAGRAEARICFFKSK